MKELIKKAHENMNNGLEMFEGFAIEEKIAVIEFQLDILDENSKSESVKKSITKYSKMLVELRKEAVLSEIDTLFTAKGVVKGFVINKNIMMVKCPKCNCEGRSLYDNSICCHCYGKAYKEIKKPKEISEIEMREILKEKYLKYCNKKRMFPHPDLDNMSTEWLNQYKNK